jgi:hypothetical protein
MNKNDLIIKIIAIKNAKRVYRDAAAEFVIQNDEVFSYLLELVFEISSKEAIKSAWVLELVCQENVLLMGNHLNLFINNLNRIKEESALRPLAKVCSFIAKSHQNNELELKKDQIDKIIEVNFDWLIDNHKVATQVFAMDTLYILGKEYNWVHIELKLILEKSFSAGSAGYQSHAKRILQELN